MNNTILNKPFENDEECLTIEDFTIENGTKKISIYGNIEISLDDSGLENLDIIIQNLEHIKKSLLIQKNNTKNNLNYEEENVIVTKTNNPFLNKNK